MAATGQAEGKLERQERTAELRVKGRTLREIAAELDVSLATIKRDMAAVERLWQQRAADKVGTWKGREVARLEAVIREAWDAWERSKEPFQKTVEKTGRPPAVKQGTAMERTRPAEQEIGAGVTLIDANADPMLEAEPLVVLSRTMTWSERDGNYHFLELVVAASAQIADILGLNSPAELNVTIQRYVEDSARELGLSPAELMREIEDVAAAAWERSSAGVP